MKQNISTLAAVWPHDIKAGVVVFLVALPLCLGVALASNAPLISGVLAGIVGGLIVGALSGSHSSVSGPAAGLTAVVAAQIAQLGSFETFLLAVILAGLMQVLMGIARLGFIAAYFPSSVIKGLLAAIGVILILKQIPHVLGHDRDPEGEMSFQQPDQETTFSELGELLADVHPGALVIGVVSVVLLLVWDNVKWLKRSLVPAPLVVVLFGVIAVTLLTSSGPNWAVRDNHLVQVPVAASLAEFGSLLKFPDFTQWQRPGLLLAAITIALVASLETLLNIEAVDRLDPQQRKTPPNRELLAQGCGNIVCGLLGGIPVTSVIVRSSVNIDAGGKSRWATLIHGALLLVFVGLLPGLVNQIPLSCLAAILLFTGFKLASWPLIKQMWKEGGNQFLPFAATVLAIVFTDLLIGVLIGMCVSIGFILHSNLRSPLRKVMEKHLGGSVLRIELANQVSFLNRAALHQALDAIPSGGHVLLDARTTDYIDPDVLDLIHDFKNDTAPARGVHVSLAGFKERYRLGDLTRYVDYTSRDMQQQITPEQVLQVLKDGNQRFRLGQQLTRNLTRQVDATAGGQFPIAAILSCIDSRSPAELIFDLGVGDIFSIRIAGNVADQNVLGSMEYACAVAGSKLVLVMGHSGCGAVTAALDSHTQSLRNATPCEHLESILSEIQDAIGDLMLPASPARKRAVVDQLARYHVRRTVRLIRSGSRLLGDLEQQGKIAIVGALYHIDSGAVDFFEHDAVSGRLS